jgi:hypothetical protein
MGFRVLTSMDQFLPETDANMAEENTPKGHVHGPGSGHDDYVHVRPHCALDYRPPAPQTQVPKIIQNQPMLLQ